MTSSPDSRSAGVPGFRRRLLVAMMLVVAGLTGSGLYIAERNLAAEVDGEIHRRFESEFAARRRVQDLRQATLAELGRSLAGKPRIHAALEDDALDLLYPSAREELKEVMGSLAAPGSGGPGGRPLHATFCRFLDHRGAVIAPPTDAEMGMLTEEEEAFLTHTGLSESEQIGYLVRSTATGARAVEEFLAVPIASTETHQSIAALVMGFESFEGTARRLVAEARMGIWTSGKLFFPSVSEEACRALAPWVTKGLSDDDPGWGRWVVPIEDLPHLMLYRRLNPGSKYPPAFEIGAFSLEGLMERQRQMRWRILMAGGGMLLAGWSVCQHLARRFSAPVERLAVDSATNRVERQRAEAALESTTVELQRSMRFSADASHQLNTPVAVLRAGLEEILARHELSAEVREELADLVHQTYRLGSVIQDLLLLSRMDAGRVQLEFSAVDLKPLIEGWLDDLSALQDAPVLEVETDVAESLTVAGDMRYTTLILQNLLENARKYNRPGGRIRVMGREELDEVFLVIGNTGSTIPPSMQGGIFDRFHRGAMGENVPGWGLGLNLSRELARLHGGDLRLAQSQDDWTEFELRLRRTTPQSANLSRPG